MSNWKCPLTAAEILDRFPILPPGRACEAHVSRKYANLEGGDIRRVDKTVWKSSDNGHTFATSLFLATVGGPGRIDNPVFSYKRTMSHDVLMLSYSNGDNNQGTLTGTTVLRSGDLGASWQQVFKDQTLHGTFNGGQYSHVGATVYSRNNPGLISYAIRNPSLNVVALSSREVIWTRWSVEN